MISITKLLGGSANLGENVCHDRGSALPVYGAALGPVVVWCATKTCNLDCPRCPSDACRESIPGELTTDEARALIDDLSSFRVPALLITGGEPLVRPDVPDLAEHATAKGIRVSVSTNGTLIDRAMAERLAHAGVRDLGISVEGDEETHDRFRGRRGAWRETLRGIRNAREAGISVGLRFTVTGDNVDDLSEVFRLAEDEGVRRLQIHHLVYSGRGAFLSGIDLGIWEKRAMMDQLFQRVDQWNADGRAIEVLTFDNHSDGPFAYLWLAENDPIRAEEAYELLQQSGGNRSGQAIAAIDSFGLVHPDPFSESHPVGNVRERKFSEVWNDSSIPLLRDLRRRRELLHGRCADCRWLDVCNGNLRARAEALTGGDMWAPDPACYLLDEEILKYATEHIA